MKLKRFLKLFSFMVIFVLGCCCTSVFAVRMKGEYKDSLGYKNTVEYEMFNLKLLDGETVKALKIYKYSCAYDLDKFLINECKKANINLRSIEYDNLRYNLIKSNGKFGLSLSIKLVDPQGKKNIDYNPLRVLLPCSPDRPNYCGKGPMCIDEVIIEDKTIRPPYSEGWKYDGHVLPDILDAGWWNSFFSCSEKQSLFGLKVDPRGDFSRFIEKQSFFGLKKETVFPCCCDTLRFYGKVMKVGQVKEILGPIAKSQQDAFIQQQERIKQEQERIKQEQERIKQKKIEKEEEQKIQRKRQEKARIAALPPDERLKTEKRKINRALLITQSRLIEREEELRNCEHYELRTGKRHSETADARHNVTVNRQRIVGLKSALRDIEEELAELSLEDKD